MTHESIVLWQQSESPHSSLEVEVPKLNGSTKPINRRVQLPSLSHDYTLYSWLKNGAKAHLSGPLISSMCRFVVRSRYEHVAVVNWTPLFSLRFHDVRLWALAIALRARSNETWSDREEAQSLHQLCPYQLFACCRCLCWPDGWDPLGLLRP